MDEGSKRLFLALWPDALTRDDVIAQTGSLVAVAGGRAVLPRNIHITLAFLHRVDNHLVPQIVAAARDAAGPAFDLSLTEIGYWYASRILWLAPSPAGPQPAKLVADLWRALAKCGFTPERRRFRPHVTLARRVETPPRRQSIGPVRWRARDFALVESITGQSQSRYEILETFPLSG